MLIHSEFQGRGTWANWQMNAFRETLDHFDLSDMGYEGSDFTWQKLCTDPNTQQARLDRATCNCTWQDHYPWSKVVHQPMFWSDHFLFIQIRDRDPIAF